MVDQIRRPVRRKILRIIGLVVIGNPADLFACPGESDKSRMELCDIGSEHIRCIAFRINRDEQRLHAVARSTQLVYRESDLH